MTLYTDGLKPIDLDGEGREKSPLEVRDWQKTTDGVKVVVDLLAEDLLTLNADFSVEWETVTHMPDPPPAKILGDGATPPMEVVTDVVIRIPVHHWQRDQVDMKKVGLKPGTRVTIKEDEWGRRTLDAPKLYVICGYPEGESPNRYERFYDIEAARKCLREEYADWADPVYVEEHIFTVGTRMTACAPVVAFLRPDWEDEVE